MGNFCHRHTTGTCPTSFSDGVIPCPTTNNIPSHSSPSPAPSSSVCRSIGANGISKGEAGDGVTSLTVERSSTSGYPTSLATLSVASDTTRTCSPSSKAKSAMERPEPLTSPCPSPPVSSFSLAADKVVQLSASFVTPSSVMPAKSLSSVSLEPADQHRLRHFYARNLRAQKRHATVKAQQRGSLQSCDSSSTSSDRVDLYDVFSPDERSTRWSEFQELLAISKQEYTSYRNATKNVRGSNKAMTIAGVRPNPNPAGQLPVMH
eukprot:GHVS01086436.1.p1 GENE.GHVS01086436.1~~GHVS01086436.1.p1  ORF type:complete len:263 (+),score=32.63 GHVS01086436.1:380-1168(+)